MAKDTDDVTGLFECKGGVSIRQSDCTLTLLRQIGRGSYSTCWLVQSHPKNGSTPPQLQVLKVMKLSPTADQMFVRETAIHSSLNHAHVVQFHTWFIHDQVPMYTMEWCVGGTLSTRVHAEQLDLAEIRAYLTQLLGAVVYLHDAHVVHRDIKPPNILLSGTNHLKLCDFGLATRWGPCDTRLTKVTGTPNFVAPEVIQRSKPGYTNLVDCWSLGCTLYYMYKGHSLYPVKRGDRRALYRAIRKNPVPSPPQRCVGVMHQILHKLLQKDPAHRLTASDGLQLLHTSDSPPLAVL